MSPSLPPRCRTPVALIVVASIALVVVAVKHGIWGALLAVPIQLALGVWFYVNAGRDTDYGAMLRLQGDERQALQRLKIFALIGRLLAAAVVIGYVCAVATKTVLWPWAVMLGVLAVSAITGFIAHASAGRGAGN